jgi:hypothetical protein
MACSLGIKSVWQMPTLTTRTITSSALGSSSWISSITNGPDFCRTTAAWMFILGAPLYNTLSDRRNRFGLG